MAQIKIKKGLDIPIAGKPEGILQEIVPSGESGVLKHPSQIGIDFLPFSETKFRLLVKLGDSVKIGQSVAEDKNHPGLYYVSPASGVISEIRRGDKRVLKTIVIQTAAGQDDYVRFQPIDIAKADPHEIIESLKISGMFPFIRVRPFNNVANPDKKPRSIFVRGLESAPFVPSTELQLEGHENDFSLGMQALAKLTDGPVHLVVREGATSRVFQDIKSVQLHTASGPHPIANASVHIAALDPIQSPDAVIWVVNAFDVARVGAVLAKGRYVHERVVSVAGPGIIPGRTGFFKVREGFPINAFIGGRVPHEDVRILSGNPLMGTAVTPDDFLGFYDNVVSVIPEQDQRQMLHFFRLGSSKYTASGAYLSGHFNNSHREYAFTTSMHGEHRALIDATMYDKVMPLPIPTMLLIKAILGGDFDRAATLGLIEVAPEDFALPAFVDPSKTEMVEIVANGLRQYEKENS